MKKILNGALRVSENYFYVENPHTKQSIKVLVDHRNKILLEYCDPEISTSLSISSKPNYQGKLGLDECKFIETNPKYGVWCRVFLFFIDVFGVWMEAQPFTRFTIRGVKLIGAWSNGAWINDYSIIIYQNGYQHHIWSIASGDYELIPIDAEPVQWKHYAPKERKELKKLDTEELDSGIKILNSEFDNIEEILKNTRYFVKEDNSAYLFYRYLEQRPWREFETLSESYYGYANKNCMFKFRSEARSVSRFMEPIFYQMGYKFETYFRRGNFFRKEYTVYLQPQLNHEYLLAAVDLNSITMDRGIIERIQCNKYYEDVIVYLEGPLSQKPSPTQMKRSIWQRFRSFIKL